MRGKTMPEWDDACRDNGLRNEALEERSLMRTRPKDSGV